MGEASGNGLIAEVDYHELVLDEDMVEGQLRLDTVWKVARAERFSLCQFRELGGGHSLLIRTEDRIGAGTVDSGDELSPAGQNVAQVLRVGIDTLLDLGASNWARSLRPEHAPAVT